MYISALAIGLIGALAGVVITIAVEVAMISYFLKKYGTNDWETKEKR